MKKIITIALLLSSFAVQAQTNKSLTNTMGQLTATNASTDYNYFSHKIPAISTQSLLLIKVGAEETLLRLTAHYKGANTFYGPIDSVTMYVKKSQIRWVNDSTAIIHKP